MIGSSIPFTVPTEFVGRLASGELTRIGGLLKSAETGRVVAHLQETGALQSGLQALLGMGGNPFATISSVVANAQLVQLKAMVQMLTTLQIVNLGAVVAGIGVSAVGFTVLARRIDKVQRGMESLAASVETRFQELFRRDLRAHVSAVRSLCIRAEEAQSRSDRAPALRNVSDALADELTYFRGELEHVLGQPQIDQDILFQMLRMFELCAAGRVHGLMHAGELTAARGSAEGIAQVHRQLFESVSVSRLARQLGAAPQAHEAQYIEVQRHQQRAKEIVSSLQELTDFALTKPMMIDTLIRRRIDIDACHRQLREDSASPMLVLAA